MHDLAVADIDANMTIGLSPAIVMDPRDGDDHAWPEDALVGRAVANIAVLPIEVAGICSDLREPKIAEDQRDPLGAVSDAKERSRLRDLHCQIGYPSRAMPRTWWKEYERTEQVPEREATRLCIQQRANAVRRLVLPGARKGPLEDEAGHGVRSRMRRP